MTPPKKSADLSALKARLAKKNAPSGGGMDIPPPGGAPPPAFGGVPAPGEAIPAPGEAIPLVGNLLGEGRAPGGIMLPEFYNELGAMHGTIMVFLGVVPLAVGGFGNFVLPLQIGAPDCAS